MPQCSCCQNYDREFDDRVARRELDAFRRHGPNRSTRLLIDALGAQGIDGCSLLDIGGGVGAIHHELLKSGASRAVDVDASAAFIAAARREAERLGHADRVAYRYGDFVELAPEIEPADVVALDRVVCCYPDMPTLVGLSVARARMLYGIVYPPEKWWIRLGISVINWFRRRGNGTQFFVHSVEAIDRTIRDAGFEPRFAGQTLMWRIAVYARTTRP